MNQEIVKLAEKIFCGMNICNDLNTKCDDCPYLVAAEKIRCSKLWAEDMKTLYKAILSESADVGKPKTVKITISADKELSKGMKKAYWRELVCARAVEHFGQIHQILKAMEELGELTTALSRWLNREGGETWEERRRDVLSEVADVEILCEQLERIFGSAQEEKDYKLARLEKRMAGERGDGD